MVLSFAIAPLAVIVFAGLVFKAGILDVLTMQISNVLVLGLILAFAVFAPLAGLTAFEIATAGAMALAVLLVGMGLFALGWLGGGDVKLIAAAALWLGAGHVLTFLTYTALAGGVLAVLVLLFRRSELPAALQRRAWAVRLHAPETGLPYGVAIAAGALLTLGETSWITAQAF